MKEFYLIVNIAWTFFFSVAANIFPQSENTWLQAYNICKNKGGKLASQSAIDNTTVPSGIYWIGIYTALSPWLWMRGCYNSGLLTDDKNIRDPGDYLTAANCATKCKNSKFIALSNLVCFCLKEDDVEKYLPNTMKTSSDDCEKCTDNEHDTCGKDDSVFLYEKYNGKPQLVEASSEEKGDYRCVFVDYDQNNTLNTMWNITKCSNKYLTLCKNLTMNGAETLWMDYSSRSAPVYRQWTESENGCRQAKGYLADIRTADELIHLEFPTQSNQPSLVWTGLYRDELSLHLKDVNFSGEYLTTCSYVVHSGDQIKVNQSDCTTTLKSLCEISDDFVPITDVTISGTVLTSQPRLTNLSSSDSGNDNVNNPEIYGTVGGVVGAGILIVIIAVVIVFKKRSIIKYKKQQEMSSTQEHAAGEYTYIVRVTDSGQGQSESKPQSLSKSNEDNQNVYSETYSQDLGQTHNTRSSTTQKQTGQLPSSSNNDYDYAKTEKVYMDSKEGEYDMLGGKREKRFNPDAKDNTYDFGGEDKDGIYNVSRNPNKTPTTTQGDDFYDTTRNIPNGDDTYDHADKKQLNISKDNVYYSSL